MIKKFNFIYILIFLVASLLQFFRVVDINNIFGVKGIFTNIDSKKIVAKIDQGVEKNINIEKQYLIIKSSEKIENELEILENLEDIFKFSKTNYIVKNDDDPTLEIEKYKNIIIIKESYLGITTEFFEKTKKTVEDGAVLFFLNGVSKSNPFFNFAGLQGEKEIKRGEGIIIVNDFYPGLQSLKIVKPYHNFQYLSSEIDKDAKIIAVNSEKKPLYWEINRGKGRVIYSNNQLFVNNYMQGFMKQLISYGSDMYISPFLNTKVFHIDDFPLPTPKGYNPGIFKDYGVELSVFFKEIWWEDMKNLAVKEDIEYTTFMIANYGVESSEKELERYIKIEEGDLSELGREAIKIGSEIGMHGYNHNPLSLYGGMNYGEEYKDYKPWENIKVMEKANKMFLGVVKKLFGEKFKIFSYVAPSNLLTAEGKKSLLNSMPDLRILCGVFQKSETDKGLLTQKVGRDPDIPEFYDFPRFSFGYIQYPEVMWDIFNGVAAYGYVSHFIHPDDVISDDRSYNMTWAEMKDDFEGIVKKVGVEYPSLIPRTQVQLALEYSKIENIKIEMKEEGDILHLKTYNYVDGYVAEYRVRGKKIKSIKGATEKITAEYDNNTLYILNINEPDVIIELGDLK